MQFFAFYLKLLAMLLISSSGAALILGLLQKLKTQVKNRDVQIESTFNVPLYLVRTPGDEASGLLTFFAFANYVGKLLFQHASPFTVRVVGPDDSVAEGKSPTRFVGVRFPVLMILSATAIGGSLFWSEPTLRPDQLLLPTLVTLCFLGSIVACVALLVHCGYCRACGMTSPLDWMSSQVYVEHGPVGVRATFEVLAPDASVEGLRHSFQDREETQERIVQILEDWLGQRCSEREA